METETNLTEADAKAAIHRLMEDWRRAASSGDIDTIMLHYTADILSFDAVSQLRFKGKDAYGAHWRSCMDMCKGTMIFEIHELVIEAGEHIGFAHYLMRCGYTTDDGEEKASWMRGTTGLRRSGANWLIAHEHFSVPFDMQNGKALFDLKP